jgi:hypothetical protein
VLAREPAVRLTGPVPAQPFGLTELWPWPGEHCVTYMAEDGRLAIVDLDQQRISAHPGHDRAAHIIGVRGDKLLSVGQDDERLLCWQMDGAVESNWVTPGKVLGGCWLAGDDDRLMLYDQSQAGLFQLGAEELVPQARLALSEVRTLAAVDQAALWQWQQHRQRVYLKQQIEQIQQLGYHQQAEAEPYHRALVEAGLAGMSVRLKASLAREAGAWIEALGHYHELLTQHVNPDQLSEAPQHYARLLRQSGWPCKALAVLEASGVDDALRRQLNCLETIDTAQLIQSPQVPWAQLIDAADAIGEPLHGRYVLQWLESAKVEARLEPADIVGYYQNMAGEHEHSVDGSSLACQPLTWVTDRSIDDYETLLLSGDKLEAIGSIELAYRAEPASQSQTRFSRAVVLSIGATSSDPRVHNQRLRHWLDQIIEPQRLVPHQDEAILQDAIKTAAMAAGRRGPVRPY